jgi:hypothetical protein
VFLAGSPALPARLFCFLPVEFEALMQVSKDDWRAMCDIGDEIALN